MKPASNAGNLFALQFDDQGTLYIMQQCLWVPVSVTGAILLSKRLFILYAHVLSAACTPSSPYHESENRIKCLNIES